MLLILKSKMFQQEHFLISAWYCSYFASILGDANNNYIDRRLKTYFIANVSSKIRKETIFAQAILGFLRM